VTSEPSGPSSTRPPRPVDVIAEDYVVASARLDPIEATFTGIAEPGVASSLTDYSLAGFAERADLNRATLRRLAAVEPADESERVAVEAMTERLALAVELNDAGIPQSQLSVIASPLHEVREVFDLADSDTEEDWVAIGARLRGVPAALEGYTATLREHAAAGQVTSRRQVAAVLEQITGWTKPGEDVFGDLVGGANDDHPSLRADLSSAAAGATAAVAQFGDFLRSELAPQAREQEAVGRDVYALTSRSFLGETIDLEETYRWGFAELARIEEQMRAVAVRITGNPDVDAAVAALDADPASRIAGKDAFRDWMQARSDEAVTALAGTHFDIPDPIRRLDCRIAPVSDGGVYYTGPSEDFSRPGQMWWSVPKGVDEFSTWRELTTVYHEGVPGHHLQVAQTAYRRDLLNRWQRMSCWVSGHGEGWALYAERLMDDLGYLDDPGAKLGMLDSQGFRATRVILDIGLHLQLPIPADNPFGFHPGETWNPELGWEFLIQHARMDHASLRFELDRYLGWPGQAPSYKIGERVWLEVRDEARRAQGAGFDLKAFHRRALDLGSIGLAPFRAAMARP
jgi:uncharacterized protein (DUF885 family)